MDSFGVTLLMLGLAVTLWITLQRDFIAGLAYAVFLWVSMTTFLRIDLPGELPELTIFRLVLILVVIAWLRHHRWAEVKNVPLAGYFAFWAIVNLLSLVGTQIDFVASLKRFLDFVFEVYVFYAVISTTLKTRDDARQVLVAAWLGLLVVAALAVVERYTGFNPVDHFVPGYVRDEVAMRDILSTYQHRILLGTAMAMGVPLTFLLMRLYDADGRPFRLGWPAVGLFAGTCYFSFSRGPWMGMALAGATMAMLGSRWTRKKMILLGLLGGLALLSRPGVVETMGGYAQATADKDSLKGANFLYRLELWRVAWSEISKNPWSMAFGCGPAAGSRMEIEWELTYRGKTEVIESWDNHYAYTLLQSGFVGLLATLLLYFSAVRPMWEGWRRAAPEFRDVPACSLATAIVLLFMMTNVLIFAKQLGYLFWTVVTAGMVLMRVQSTLEQHQHDAEAELVSLAEAEPTVP